MDFIERRTGRRIHGSGIPLWVHRRCRYPMFTISNVISYEKLMVQGVESYGKTGWFDVGGTADNKYVEAQGEFLLQKLREMIDKNPKITDRNEKDVIYCDYSPFSNVAISTFTENCGKFILPDMMSKGNRPMSELSIPFRGKRLRLFFLYSAARQAEQRRGTLGGNGSEYTECCGYESKRGVLYHR